MRSAEEILDKNIFNKFDTIDRQAFINAINEARKEAIEECAKKADLKLGRNEDDWQIDTDSILNLIKELK